MKKIYLAFLIVVGSSLQSGNAQIASSGGGELAVKSNEQGCATVTYRENRINPEKDCSAASSKSNMTKNTETVSQLDPITMQMAKAAIIQMQERGKISVQDSVGKIMKDFSAQDHGIMAAITARGDSVASWDSSGAYLGQPVPNEILDIIAPGLLADRESFARDIIKSLLR